MTIISDSPSSQYRNRSMMYLMTQLCKSHGISAFEWLFSETGHGKGAPDGVGACVKRMADAFVAEQLHSINGAKDVIPLLNETKINAMIVSIFLMSGSRPNEYQNFPIHVHVEIKCELMFFLLYTILICIRKYCFRG